MTHLQSIKDEIAKKIGLSDYAHYISRINREDTTVAVGYFEEFMNQVAKRYAEEEAIAFSEWLKRTNTFHSINNISVLYKMFKNQTESK